MRTLETVEYVANKEHFCDNCCRYIMPGEIYERQTSLLQKGEFGVSEKKIDVRRRHVYPECDHPEEPEEARESMSHPENQYLTKAA